MAASCARAADSGPTPAVRRAADLAAALAHIRHAEQEHFYAIGLDSQHRIVLVTIAAIGTVDRVAVALRDVFREAVRANLPALALVHNHPSGEVNPSDQDRELTYRAEQAARLLGIDLIDHVIIAGDAYYSFAEHDLITPREER